MTGGDLTLKLSYTAPSQLQAFLVGFPDTMVAMKAMKAGARAMTGGELTKKNRRVHAAQEQGREGCVRRPADHRLREVKKTEKFVIPQLTTLKLKHKPARKAGTKVMFGKEVKVAAKPASKVVKAFPAKALKDSI